MKDIDPYFVIALGFSLLATIGAATLLAVTFIGFWWIATHVQIV